MVARVKPVPDEYRSATPYLIVKGGASALDFYQRAFGATEVMRFPGPNGTIGHAEIQIGEARVMLADEHPEMGYKNPQTIGGTPVGIMLYVENVDAFVDRATRAGATLMRPVENQFYGDRSGSVVDPFGHQWHVATHIEDVSMDELVSRSQQMAQRGHQSHET